MLYLVGTPIGNIKDITERALLTLSEVDYIACEDTRHSGLLLSRYGIKKPLISYHQRKEQEGAARILALLHEGKSVALISDAGMPCISDPGSILVNKARAEGIKIEMIPGPTALTSALSLAGISSGFVFIGFLSEKNKERKEQLEPFIHSPLPLALYCSPHDLERVTSYLLESLGERTLYIVKEITKIYESVEITTLSTGTQNPIKGEYVLIVEGYKKEYVKDISILEHLQGFIKEGMDKKEAIKKVAEERGIRREEVYKVAIKLGKN